MGVHCSQWQFKWVPIGSDALPNVLKGLIISTLRSKKNITPQSFKMTIKGYLAIEEALK